MKACSQRDMDAVFADLLVGWLFLVFGVSENLGVKITKVGEKLELWI